MVDLIADGESGSSVRTKINAALGAIPAGGTAGQVLSKVDGTDYNTEWATGGGGGDVTAASAFGTDNVVIRSDGTGKGVQATGITIDDSDNTVSTGYTRSDAGFSFGRAPATVNYSFDALKNFAGLLEFRLQNEDTGGSSGCRLTLDSFGGIFQIIQYPSSAYFVTNTAMILQSSAGSKIIQLFSGAVETLRSNETYLDARVPLKLKSYTVATLPAASVGAGSMIFVTDETGGAVPAFSDGTDWRRVTDRAIVS